MSTPLRLFPCLLALALGAALSACSTPQAALDQGNATGALGARFDAELEAYRKAAARVAQARLDSIRRQEALMVQMAESDAWDLRTARLAGLGDAEDQRRALVELAASRESDEVASRERLAEIELQLKAVVTPLPSTSSKLAELKKALAAMGTELPADERLKLALDAVQTVLDEVAKNREAEKAIEAKQAVAGVPASPVTKEPQP
jgi:hypothetical protein